MKLNKTENVANMVIKAAVTTVKWFSHCKSQAMTAIVRIYFYLGKGFYSTLYCLFIKYYNLCYFVYNIFVLEIFMQQIHCMIKKFHHFTQNESSRIMVVSTSAGIGFQVHRASTEGMLHKRRSFTPSVVADQELSSCFLTGGLQIIACSWSDYCGYGFSFFVWACIFLES